MECGLCQRRGTLFSGHIIAPVDSRYIGMAYHDQGYGYQSQGLGAGACRRLLGVVFSQHPELVEAAVFYSRPAASACDRSLDQGDGLLLQLESNRRRLSVGAEQYECLRLDCLLQRPDLFLGGTDCGGGATLWRRVGGGRTFDVGRGGSESGPTSDPHRGQ